ncbi:conserved hypothetical protein [Ricinus communis]|uniref:Reverse transcriptase zinc-binding domain-containing protein n=1 Tax=Ricinus communis TaxID=3988 RepID=B9RU45_RICCO|nr:conserved hypothetical protein [Ricinus communis]
MVNYDKSEVCFGKGMDPILSNFLASYLGVTTVDCHEKYLGILCPFDAPLLPSDAMISDLITIGGVWDVGLLQQVFRNDIVQCQIVEHGNLVHGVYTVKSGYRVALRLKDISESSNSNCSMLWWKILWRTQLRPKVKQFVWRFCKGWLFQQDQLSIFEVFKLIIVVLDVDFMKTL